MSVWRRKLRKAAFMSFFGVSSSLIRVPGQPGPSHLAQSQLWIKSALSYKSQGAHQGGQYWEGLLEVVWVEVIRNQCLSQSQNQQRDMAQGEGCKRGLDGQSGVRLDMGEMGVALEHSAVVWVVAAGTGAL